jgi:pimeloyl-ACP methyl ester carboxylesterase
VEIARTLRTRDGVTLAYRVSRASAARGTLVLLHGLASNLTRWSEFVATTGLAASWNLLRLDLRGHAGSLDRGRIGFEEWCADIAALLRAEGVRRAVLAGHCLGANLALWFAARSPREVSGLVLIEPMFREALRGPLATVAALRPLLGALVPPLRALAALGLHRRRLEALDLAALDLEARAAMAHPGAGFPAARYASPLEDLKSLPLSVYVQDLLAVTGPLPDLAGVAAPSLALVSTGTSFGDPEIAARQLARLPNVEIERLAARHWIPAERPQEMIALIERWCGRLAAGS